MAPVKPSKAAQKARKIVGINPETVTNVSSSDFPGHFVGEDHAWNVDEFRENFQVKFHQNDAYDAAFSIVGIDASVANAFRRILLAEVPTLAIDQVFFHQNTSIIQDEVLAHRLGLVPLIGNPEALKWMELLPEPEPSQQPMNTDQNTIILKLHTHCTWNDNRAPGEDDPLKMYNNAHVYAKDLVWTPHGRQAEMFGDEPIRPMNPDILLVKMRPGQEVELECHCIKGFGSDHAKFSPVATATYRLLPTIDILRPIVGNDAVKFQGCFPKGVIELEPVTEEDASAMDSEYDGLVGQQKAVVKDAFRDTVSRECLRHEEFQGKVKLGRVRDHFIYSVESTGQIRSDELFLQSVEVLRLKCAEYRRELSEASWT